jgi:arylsulfatase A-like enzyme
MLWRFAKKLIMPEERPARRIPWRIALAWVGCIAALVDLLFGHRPNFVAIVATIGLGLAAGAAAGTVLDLLSWPLRRLPSWASRSLWLLPGLAGGWWLIDELGALARVTGPYRDLAIYTLLAAVAGGLVVSGSLAVLQPSRKLPEGWLPSRRILRWIVTAVWLLGAAVMTYVDRTRFLDLYSSAHLALRVLSVVFVAASVVALGTVRASFLRARRVAFVLAVIVGILPLFLLRDPDAQAVDQLLSRPLPALALTTGRTLTDFDRDGFSSLLGGGDCEPWRAAANPSVAEIPDNGVDDNCQFGDRVTQFHDDPEEPEPKLDGPVPNVVVITIDATRPDHMSLYGYERDTTPNLSRFAKDAVVFEHAYSPSTWTSLAVPALLRGVFPRRMRWTRVGETNRYRLLRTTQYGALAKGERLRLMFGLPLDEPRPPYPKRLLEGGFHTIAVVDDGYSQFLSKKAGVDEGFAYFRQTDSLPKKKRNDLGTTQLALEALRARPADKPFLLWIHYFGPHDPSTKHRDLEQYGSSVTDMYDQEIRFADLAVAPVLEELEKIKERPMAIFIAADHGETLLEKRRLHGSGLSECTSRIPLIVRLPGVAPQRSQQLVSLVDIPATILRMTGIRGSASMDGKDLRDLLASPTLVPRVLISDTWRFKKSGDPWYDVVAAYNGEYKLQFNRNLNLRRLFRQDDQGRPPKNYLDEVPVPPELKDALGAYLEQTGGPPDMHD